MQNKTYLYIIIAITIIIVIFSISQITGLQSQIKELKTQETDCLDEHQCNDLFYDNENLVILYVDEQEEYCKELLR